MARGYSSTSKTFSPAADPHGQRGDLVYEASGLDGCEGAALALGRKLVQGGAADFELVARFSAVMPMW